MIKQDFRKINWALWAGMLLVIIAVVLLGWFFLKGETKVSGNWPEPETAQSVVCEAEGVLYPFFKYDNSDRKTMTVKAIFKNDALYSIALTNMLYYSDIAKIDLSESENHAAVNLKSQAEGLGADVMDSKYSKLDNGMKMSMYALAKDVTSEAAKYLMLDVAPENGQYSLSLIKEIFTKKGFNCVEN